MSDETSHELLSAYLDGELAADERQRVEQLLAENADCRQAYEELRALRASLASLPRHTLDENLAPNVIRMAEQAMLGKARTPAAMPARPGQGEAIEAATGEVAEAGGVSAADRRSRAWRAIIYPLLAVAAAVAMILNSPEKNVRRERQIAQTPLKQAPPATLSAPSGPRAAEEPSTFESSRTLSEAESEKRVAGGVAAQFADDDRAAPSGGHVDGYAAKPRDTNIQSAAPTPIAAENGRKLGLETPPTLVITCKLAPTAVRDKAFDTLLARNHLMPEIAAGRAGKLAENSAAPTFEFSVIEQHKKKSETAPEALVQESPGRKDNAWSKSVVVELDAEQLVAVLADLQNHPAQFLSVELPGQFTDDEERAADLRIAADAASSLADSASAEPAAESVVSLKADSASAGAAEGGANRGNSGRLRVVFRLSAASGD